jgi:hypothetical protein
MPFYILEHGSATKIHTAIMKFNAKHGGGGSAVSIFALF